VGNKNNSPKATAAETAETAERGPQIANLNKVAEQLGKSPQRVRALVNDGVAVDGMEQPFRLATDIVTLPGFDDIEYRVIRADSVAEYQRLSAAGKIGARRGSDMVAYVVWLPKDATAAQPHLDYFTANSLQHKVRNPKAADADDSAED
jgi:hypothetical protein